MSDVIAPATPAATGTNIDAVASVAGKTAQRTANNPSAVPAPQSRANEVAAPTENKGPDLNQEFETKSNGKTKKVTLKELLEKYPLVDTAYQNMESGAKAKKEAEALLSRLRDPKKAIELLNDPKMGLNPDEVRTAFEDWYHEKVVKRAEMSQEQRELADAKERIAAYEKEKADEKQRLEAERDEAETAEEARKIQMEIRDILETSNLPKTKFTTGRLAHWMRVNESKGLNAPKEVLVQQVQHEMRQLVASLTEASDGDVLVSLLGDNAVKKLRKYDIDKIRASRQQKPTNDEPNRMDRALNADGQETIDVREVKRRLREWK